MNQSMIHRSNLRFTSAITALLICFLLLGNSAQAQGMMRGETSAVREEVTTETVKMRGEDGSTTDLEGLDTESQMATQSEMATAAHSAEASIPGTALFDDEFEATLNVHEIGEIESTHMKYEMRKLVKENESLKVEMEKQEQVLEARIAKLEARIRDIQDGWEVID